MCQLADRREVRKASVASSTLVETIGNAGAFGGGKRRQVPSSQYAYHSAPHITVSAHRIGSYSYLLQDKTILASLFTRPQIANGTDKSRMGRTSHIAPSSTATYSRKTRRRLIFIRRGSADEECQC